MDHACHDRHQRVTLFDHHPAELFVFFRDDGVLELFTASQDRGHRCSDFVTHLREKGGLGTIGRLGGVAHCLKFQLVDLSG